jgi:hypothetical protein
MKVWTVILIFLGIVLGPILTNFIIKTYIPLPFKYLTPFGNQKDWLSFFGNYSGGIIGGLSAYVIARMQIKDSQMDGKQKNIKDQLGVLKIIKLDLMTIKLAFKDFEDQIRTKPDYKGSICPNLTLSYDIWSKVGLISNEEIQTALFQAQNFYKECIDGLSKDIGSAEKTIAQVEKTIRLINVNTTNIEESVKLSELLIVKDSLIQNINLYSKKRKAALNLLNNNYIVILSELENTIDRYIEELKSELSEIIS